MTVGELIKYLKLQNQNAEVVMGQYSADDIYRYVEIKEVNSHASGYDHKWQKFVSLDN